MGCSTNLINPGSNIITIRGGSRPVHDQMVNAMAKFFQKRQTITNDQLVPASPDAEQPIPLQRINTGLSSIVGTENAERPGGFVLVVDGSALLEVSRRALIYFSVFHSNFLFIGIRE